MVPSRSVSARTHFLIAAYNAIPTLKSPLEPVEVVIARSQTAEARADTFIIHKQKSVLAWRVLLFDFLSLGRGKHRKCPTQKAGSPLLEKRGMSIQRKSRSQLAACVVHARRKLVASSDANPNYSIPQHCSSIEGNVEERQYNCQVTALKCCLITVARAGTIEPIVIFMLTSPLSRKQKQGVTHKKTRG